MPLSEVVTSPQNIVGITGRYTLGHQPKRPGENVFAFKLKSITPETFVAAVPVPGLVGQQVWADLGPFGAVTGHITRLVSDGFAVEIHNSSGEREALAERITAFRNKPWTGLHDQRVAERFLPGEPRSVIIFDDGSIKPCLIIDYSSHGAAISADIHPTIGAHLTIGEVGANVVRLLDVGFAVQFDEQHHEDEIEAMLEAPREWESAIAVRARVAIDTTEPDDRSDSYGYD